MIDQILDTLIPESPELGMPSATSIGFHLYAERYGIQNLVSEFTALVSTLSAEKFERSFPELADKDRLALLNAARTANIRLFSAFLTHVFRAYYTHPDVLAQIGSGALPPFPDGKIIEEDDWCILEDVYERGPIFRTVEETSK